MSTPKFNVERIYTVHGQGMGVVIDHDMPSIWFRPEGSVVWMYKGKPKMNLDGGAHADTPAEVFSPAVAEMLLEDHPLAETIDLKNARAWIKAIENAKERS